MENEADHKKNKMKLVKGGVKSCRYMVMTVYGNYCRFTRGGCRGYQFHQELKESLLKLRLLEPHCGNRDMINVTDSLKTNYTHKMIF